MVAAVALLLLSSMALSSHAAAVIYEPEPEFCKRTAIVDPLQPFAQMPELHQPSRGGRIGFGPASLRLLATPSVRVSEGEVGFTLSVAQRRGLSLPWTAKATIVAVDAKGRPVGKPRRMTRKVGWLKPWIGKRFLFEVPGRPAFYRTTILLTGASGQTLGKFSFYTQMAKAHPEARLDLNASSYRPESTVFMRVENLGNLAAFYGVDYDVEKREGDTWVEAPESPHGPTILISISALPNTSGPCTGFGVPATMAPGTYRIAKEVNFVFPYGPGNIGKNLRKRGPKAILTAEFQVVP